MKVDWYVVAALTIIFIGCFVVGFGIGLILWP